MNRRTRSRWYKTTGRLVMTSRPDSTLLRILDAETRQFITQSNNPETVVIDALVKATEKR